MYLVPVRMTVTPDDELLLLTFNLDLNKAFILLTYDMQGNLLDNQTISTESWPAYMGVIVFIILELQDWVTLRLIFS